MMNDDDDDDDGDGDGGDDGDGGGGGGGGGGSFRVKNHVMSLSSPPILAKAKIPAS